MPIHLHLPNAVPVAPPTAMRRERAFFRAKVAGQINGRVCGVGVHNSGGRCGSHLVEVMVLPREQPPEPTFPLPPAMRIGLPNRPAMHDTQNPEPELVQFAKHNFLLDHDAEHVGDLGGEFDVVAQIQFRLLAVCLPQFSEGFAIAVLRAHPEVARN